jgi:hypothetical protein
VGQERPAEFRGQGAGRAGGGVRVSAPRDHRGLGGRAEQEAPQVILVGQRIAHRPPGDLGEPPGRRGGGRVGLGHHAEE